MKNKRQQQVGELVKRNFGILLQSEGIYVYGAEPLVTVTNVKMSPDMGIANIYLSVYNVDDKQTVILEMETVNKELRQKLGQRLRRHVRRIPEINFFLDDTLDEMDRLNKLFNNLHETDQMGESNKEVEDEK